MDRGRFALAGCVACLSSVLSVSALIGTLPCDTHTLYDNSEGYDDELRVYVYWDGTSEDSDEMWSHVSVNQWVDIQGSGGGSIRLLCQNATKQIETENENDEFVTGARRPYQLGSIPGSWHWPVPAQGDTVQVLDRYSRALLFEGVITYEPYDNTECSTWIQEWTLGQATDYQDRFFYYKWTFTINPSSGCDLHFSLQTAIASGALGTLECWIDGASVGSWAIDNQGNLDVQTFTATVNKENYSGLYEVAWLFDGNQIQVDLLDTDTPCDEESIEFAVIHSVPSGPEPEGPNPITDPAPNPEPITDPGPVDPIDPDPTVNNEYNNYDYNYGDDPASTNGNDGLSQDELYEAMRRALNDEGNLYEGAVPGPDDDTDFSDIETGGEAGQEAWEAMTDALNAMDGTRGELEYALGSLLLADLGGGIGTQYTFPVDLPIVGALTVDLQPYSSWISIMRLMMEFVVYWWAFWVGLRFIRDAIA
jgi:hypothetical protein